MKRKRSKSAGFPASFGVLLVVVLSSPKLLAWGGLPHQQIIDGALTAIPASDQISLRLGPEAGHLRDTVEMGDWMNSLIVVQENWHVTTEDYPQVESEYFGNDYLLFPAAPHFFSHIMPQVHDTYTPFFLRALQALRTEDQANAVRWMGSLLHFVTDSGSPPHTIGLTGPNHTKMENWLDASKIDLRGYDPQLLGNTDQQAVVGLRKRMDGLIARNAKIAKRMLPYAEANDRAHIEPMALDCAEETARVAADVIHTLLVLSAKPAEADTASLVATVTAPALTEHPQLPAKLVLLGTNFSTLSSLDDSNARQYMGTFSLRNLPAGTYSAAIERPGAETLFLPSFTVRSGQQAHFTWALQGTSPPGNLVQNSDFKLHWISSGSPDHWHHDPACHCWLSDNIPVVHGHSYRLYVVPSQSSTREATVQWMALHWQQTNDPPIRIPAVQQLSGATTVTAPPMATYGRIAIAGDGPPQNTIREAVMIPCHHDCL
ncbi:MAG TPA: hypothetical protein VMU57_16060 [Edaphobacter sp.]|uniref:hypothetical protein n=1 Tax=Edaphobacter sp. TaxID=1934404 RepID=UPI002D0B022E|nr:hypothetical protein [Edaphobacter sp.]HUZ96419.1 hypothetical protein [Edaphobacter sp.]